MTRWTSNRPWLVVAWAVIAAACGSEASRQDGSSGADGGGGADGGSGGAGGAGGAATIVPRTCRSGDPCSEGAECGWWYIETGVTCVCDPSGHFFCDPGGGGGSPPWAPCTEGWAKDNYGACAPPATSCTESNGWCTRTCTCGGTCEMTCDGDAPLPDGPEVLCDADYCEHGQYGGGCKFIEGDCDYQVACGAEGEVTITGSCP